MSENKYLADMIDIVSPLPERREEAWLILQRKIELMRSRMAHLTAKKRAFDLSPAKHRDALKRLSRTLAKAAWQARGLGPDNALMRSSLEDALKIEGETLSSDLSDHLEICRQTVDDFAERVIVWKGSQLRDPRSALSVHYALSMMVRYSDKRILSTEGGAFWSLANAMHQYAFEKEPNEELGRYVKREVKFHKKQPKNSEK